MRLIDADKYKDELNNIYHTMSREIDVDDCANYNRGVYAAEQLLDEQPTVKPQTKCIAKIKIDEDKMKEICNKDVQDLIWIPCSEKFPELDDRNDVILQNKNGCIVIGHYFDDASYDSGFDDGGIGWTDTDGNEVWEFNDCIAWMPMPKRYMGN